MTQLSPKQIPENTRTYGYDREAVTSGIVHFGIGNFHRAHQAVYVDDLLERGGTKWGITGVSLRSPAMQEKLRPQGYLYTLAVLGQATEYRVIGAIKDVLVAPADPQAVMNLIVAPKTQLISSTITEKGYYLASGRVDFENPILKTEVTSLDNPMTIYGYLAGGLIQRFQNAPSSKLTIMCCDNISSGGELLKDGVEYLLKQHNLEALFWARKNVSFISSMVDRVSPATDDKLRDLVFQDTGQRDAAPVSAEPFSQWIIEDNFAGDRPEFDTVGAIFVDNIEPFERMKLGYLNAAHTLVSTLGFLHGDIYVHETLERPDVFRFMEEALYRNVLPNASVPDGYDGRTYIEDVVKRFQNGNLPYANLQVGTDSSQKIQQRWFPTIDQAIKQKSDTSYFEFCIAAWIIFVQRALENDVWNDPKRSDFEAVDEAGLDQIIASYLAITNVEDFAIGRDVEFVTAVSAYARDIKDEGIESALRAFLRTQRDSSMTSGENKHVE